MTKESPLTAPQILYKTPNEVCSAAVDFRGKLNRGEYLTGTPTVSASPAGLTVGNAAVTTVEQEILGRVVPAGQAVTFTVSSGVADTEYVVTVNCQTTGGQTREGYVTVRVATK
jgi:hypothetical protein